MTIEIGINGRPIETVIIVRRQTLTDPDEVYKYSAVLMSGGEPVILKHRYSDGALVLAKKAIEALLEPGGNQVASTGEKEYTHIPPP